TDDYCALSCTKGSHNQLSVAHMMNEVVGLEASSSKAYGMPSVVGLTNPSIDVMVGNNANIGEKNDSTPEVTVPPNFDNEGKNVTSLVSDHRVDNPDVDDEVIEVDSDSTPANDDGIHDKAKSSASSEYVDET
ncbi:hypothetical protein A2U01_0057779, partial [Trifolium medium]|nr:hypothetical protein [Trifolium medium]